MRDLSEIRRELDVLDRQMTELFQDRLKLVAEVAEYKIATGKPVLDVKREAQKLDILSALAADEFSKEGIRELFAQIMAISRKKQYQLLTDSGKCEETGFTMVDDIDRSGARVVYQGVAGAYSQVAMKQYFGQSQEGIAVDTWRDAMEALKNHSADYAVLPIENSSSGVISEVYDLLMAYEHTIVDEVTLPVNHALLGLPGATLADIDCVYSHPQALMQCVDFLDAHREWKRISLKNTALSAKKVVEDQKKNQAAIANPLTAQLYGLTILKEQINYSRENSTRFIIVSSKKICRRNANKVSICFEVRHESGSLYRMLSHIIYNNRNMNKIESRPIKDKSFEYRFFVDFDGNLSDSAVQNALRGIREEANMLRILGNY